MDLSNVKEELKQFLSNTYSVIVNSSAFYFVKEKYDHLSPPYRKGIYITCLLLLAGGLLYYPFSQLYLSHTYIRDFKLKKSLTQNLMELSATNSMASSNTYTYGQDPVRFIKNRLPVLRISKDKIKHVKLVKPDKQIKQLNISANLEAVEVEIEKLNLKELVQYGYELENFSDNMKLTGLRVQEAPIGSNYFNVAYVFNIFNLKKVRGSSQILNQPLKPVQKKGFLQKKPLRAGKAKLESPEQPKKKLNQKPPQKGIQTIGI